MAWPSWFKETHINKYLFCVQGISLYSAGYRKKEKARGFSKWGRSRRYDEKCLIAKLMVHITCSIGTKMGKILDHKEQRKICNKMGEGTNSWKLGLWIDGEHSSGENF